MYDYVNNRYKEEQYYTYMMLIHLMILISMVVGKIFDWSLSLKISIHLQIGYRIVYACNYPKIALLHFFYRNIHPIENFMSLMIGGILPMQLIQSFWVQLPLTFIYLFITSYAYINNLANAFRANKPRL